MSTQLEPKRLGIIYPSGVDVNTWEKNYEEGLVPDRWPYGLNRLAPPQYEVDALHGRILGMGEKANLAAGVLLHKRRAGRRSDLHASVAWDEYTAAKMVAQHPARAMFSGVIWATDAWRTRGLYARGEITRRLLMSFTGLWCLSRPQVQEIERKTKGRVPVDFLPFGIDHNFFSFAEQPEQIRILSLGVDRDRDPSTLLDSLEIVHRAIPSAEIMIQTDSDHVMPAGVTKFDRVPHAVLRDLYRTATVVLVPTRHNLHASGMTVALEAGATGRPVVACSTPGMEDYIIHGLTGLLVPPNDPESMAKATLEIVKDREFASSLGRSARAHVEESHTSDLMVNKLSKIVGKGL